MIRNQLFRTLSTNVVILVLGLTASLLISRWMGPEGRGEVAAAMLWPLLFVFIGSLGVIYAMLYFSANSNDDIGLILGNGIILSLFQSVVTIVAGYVLLPVFLKSQPITVIFASRIYLFVIPLSMILQCGTSVLQGKKKLFAYNILRLIIPIGYFIGIIVLELSKKMNVTNIVFVHLLSHFIALVITFVVIIRSDFRIYLRVDTSIIKKIIRYGFQVQIGDISQLANLRLDQALIAAWMPASELGLYVVAVSCAGFLQSLSDAARIVIAPNIPVKSSPIEQISFLQIFFRRYFILSSIMVLILSLIVPIVIPLVFGVAFNGSILTTEILLVAAIFIGSKDVLSSALRVLGQPFLVSRAELISLLVSIVSLLVLLPVIGIVGAAIASLLAYLVQLLIILHGFRRLYAIKYSSLFLFDINDIKFIFISINDLLKFI